MRSHFSVPSLLERSTSRGQDWAEKHRGTGPVLVIGFCFAVVGIAVGQALWRWAGARSAVSLTVGLVLGVIACVQILKSLRMPSPRSGAVLQFWNVVGLLAAIPTLLFWNKAEPGPTLGAVQAIADGYIASIFAGMIFFVRRARHDLSN